MRLKQEIIKAIDETLNKYEKQVNDNFTVYITEFKRVLRESGVDEEIIYDAGHNAMIVLEAQKSKGEQSAK